MNFKQWLQQEVDYNNSGVPVFAPTDTPAIRPNFLDAPGVGNGENPMGDSLATLSNIRDRRQAVVKRFGASSFKQLPGQEFVTAAREPGVIQKATELNLKANIAGNPKPKSMSWFDALAVSQIKPCDRCFSGPN